MGVLYGPNTSLTVLGHEMSSGGRRREVWIGCTGDNRTLSPVFLTLWVRASAQGQEVRSLRAISATRKQGDHDLGS